MTLLSLLVHIIVITLILLEKGNNFSAPTSSYLSLLFTIAHFLYIILDNSDGKQARRTNSCTSLGLLLDHGIDAIVTSLMAIDIAHMMRIGNTMKSFIVFFANTYAFWTIMYEEYVVGFLNLGIINGADEGNLIVVIASIINFTFGDKFWYNEIDLGFRTAFYIDIVLFALIIGSVCTLVNSLNNMIKVKGFRIVFKYLYDSILMIFVMLFPWINLMLLKKGEFEDNLLTIYFITSIMFCRICINIQCDIVGNQVYNSRRFTTIILSYILYLILLLTREQILNETKIDYVLISMLAILTISFLHFIIDVTQTLLNFLDIHFLKIPYTNELKDK